MRDYQQICVDNKWPWNYGYEFNNHVHAYWIAKKIVVKLDDQAAFWGCPAPYYATYEDYDLDCKIGYGRNAAEAIEELLIAME